MRISDWSSDVCSSDLLFLEMPRHLLVDALEQRIERLVEAVAEDTVFLGLLLRRTHLFGEVEVHRRLPLLVPFAELDQMILEPRDRIAQRPRRRLARRAILRRTVRGRVAFGALGARCDQSRAGIG